MTSQPMTPQSLLVIIFILSGALAQFQKEFDMTTNDTCTVRMGRCLDTLEAAFGGEETIGRYSVEELVGNRDNMFGILDWQPIGRRKRQTSDTLHRVDTAGRMRRVRRQGSFVPHGGGYTPPKPPGPELLTTEEIMLSQMSFLWWDELADQVKTCQFMKTVNFTEVDQGHICMKRVAADETCAPKFGDLVYSMGMLPLGHIYDVIQEALCSKECERMSEKFQAVVQCDFIDSLGESLKEPAQSVLRAMGSGADTTQLCGTILNGTECPVQAVGCCQHVLPEFGEMESLPKPVYGECRVKRQPDCGRDPGPKTEPQRPSQPRKPTSSGPRHQTPHVVCALIVIIAVFL